MTALIPSCALLRKDSAGRCSASLVTLVRCASLVHNSERKHAHTRAHKFHVKVKETGNHFVHLFLARETPKIELHEALIRPSPPPHTKGFSTLLDWQHSTIYASSFAFFILSLLFISSLFSMTFSSRYSIISSYIRL